MRLSVVVLLFLSGCGRHAALPGDGGSSSGGGSDGGPIAMSCPHAADPPLATGTCQVTAGSAGLLITGTVLTPGRVLHGGQLFVDGGGTITCVGCDCSAPAAGATQINCPTGVVSPGLINTHDHITYTMDAPSADSGERYEQRHDWRKGLRGHTVLPAPGGGTTDQVHWGELRFLLGGATSTVGSGAAAGLLRNLDRAANLEGLNEGAVFFDTFPLGDSSGTQLTSACSYPKLPALATVQGDHAYEPHVAEGIDDVAHNEFTCLSSTKGVDVAVAQSAFIHAIALGAADYKTMADGGASLIWSPRSNIRLYGNTAQAPAAARVGVNVALGTDWLPSGSMSLLRELACVDALNTTYYDHAFSDEDLWLMVTRNAARATHDDNLIGVLQQGAVGDIAIFDGASRAEHRAVIGAGPADVVLVVRGGKPLYGDQPIMDALSPGCDALDVCSRAKSVCLMSDIGQNLATLKTAVGAIYPAFFCGAPDLEPTCTPSRPMSVAGSTIYTGQPGAGDRDGDGVPDASDNCPTVFNPVRPVDQGKQPDGDGDGAGDACDAAPLDPARR